MPKSETTKSRIIPGFSCLQMKREIQAKFYKETKNMTTEELLVHIQKGAGRFDEEQKQQQAERQHSTSGTEPAA